MCYQNNIHNQFAKEIKQSHEQVVKQENAKNKDEKYDAKEKGKGEYTGNHSGGKKQKRDSDGEVKSKNSGGFDVKI